MVTEKELNVTLLAPREKHPTIFRTFDALEPGDHFILVNDHDPRPLRHQFNFERPDQCVWEYLEQGPEVWKVRITRSR